MSDAYNEDLARNPANFQPLTPLTFLERGKRVSSIQRLFMVICAGLTLNFTSERVSLLQP